MKRLIVSTTILAIAFAPMTLPAVAQTASKPLQLAQGMSPVQPEEARAAKSVACRKQAKEQKLSGAKRRAFLKDCMKK